MRRLSTVVVSAAAWIATAACYETPLMPDTAVTVTKPAPQDVVGLWRISTSSDARRCLLALNLNAAPGGYGVVLEDCRLPNIAKARSWRTTPTGIELRDENGAILARLRRDTVDAYDTESEGLDYRMERAPLP